MITMVRIVVMTMQITHIYEHWGAFLLGWFHFLRTSVTKDRDDRTFVYNHL
jgi:hypothetical protein